MSQAFPAWLSSRIPSARRRNGKPRTLLRETCEIDELVGGISRTAGLVDNVLDGANTAEGDGQKILELHPGSKRDLKSMIIHDTRVDIEVAIGSHAKRLMRLDPVRNLVGRESINAVVRIGSLIRRVIRHLVLEEDRFAVLAVPDDLVVLVMFDE
jgi:hypothetical protein